MPCTYFETEEEKRAAARKDAEKVVKPLKDQVNTLTKLLCEATKVLVANHSCNPADSNKPLLATCSSDLQAWHKNHAESDKARKSAATKKLIECAEKLGYDVADAEKLAALLR